MQKRPLKKINQQKNNMQDKPTFSEKASHWLKNSLTIRLITIGILILFLLIPVSMVKDVIKERRYRQEKSTREVSAKWGESQTVLGLVLTVPYHSYTKVYDNDQKIIFEEGMKKTIKWFKEKIRMESKDYQI